MEDLRRLLHQYLKVTVVSTALLTSLLLYALGVKFVLIPVLVALCVLYLPTPAIVKSVVGRSVVALLIVMSILQVVATLQFLVLPKSGFMAMAALSAVLMGIILCFTPSRNDKRVVWVSKADVCSLIVIGFFLLPFAPIFAGQDSVRKIAEIGGIQAIDATNHYATITEATDAEHFTYSPGYYYPRGFHLATGFLQNTVFESQFSLGWRGNAVLYFAQYVAFGALVAYLVYYFCLACMSVFKMRLGGWRSHIFVALSLGPMLALLYLVPFVNEGFLNYYYVCATVLLGSLFLFALKDSTAVESREWQLPLQDGLARWWLFAYLLLVFGASVSWPLLVPPLLAVGLWCILPPNMNIWLLIKELPKVRLWPLWIVFALHLIPIYFQLKFSDSDGTQGINLTGGLRTFHWLVLLAGIGILVTLLLRAKADIAQRRAFFTVFVPLAAFIGLLVVMQYFMTGEIRYYVIKSALLLEIMFLGLGVAGLFLAFQRFGNTEMKYMLLLPVVPIIALPLLLSPAPNPFKGSRDVLRDYSHEAKPPFFEQDVQTYARLGSEGKIAHFNSTSLHYGQEQQKFFSHMQVAFWSNMMQYQASEADFRGLHCIGAVYTNLNFGTYSDNEQRAAIAKIKDCAREANKLGHTFYLVTDEASAPLMRQAFGNLVSVVY